MSTWFIASVGDEPWHVAEVQSWKDMVRLDRVGLHVLHDAPDTADRVLFVDLHQHPADRYLGALRRHELARTLPDRIVVHDRRDRPTFTFPGVYVGATGARPGVVGGPYPELYTDVDTSDQEPDLLWSFAGARTHPVRDQLFLLEPRRAVLRDTTTVPMFTADTTEGHQAVQAARDAYRLLLARSKFVLCPRGHGPSSYRLFESMAAGRVPVVLSDSWLPPPAINWEQTIIRVPERHAAAVPDLLREAEAEWPAMAAQVRRVWAENFAPDRLWNYLAEALVSLDRPHHRPWWADRSVVRSAAASVARGRMLHR